MNRSSSDEAVPRIHVVTDDAVLNRPDFIELAGMMTAPGVAVHLRSRTIPGRQLQELAMALRSGGVETIVNDRVDVAIAARANGVHLPELGLPLHLVREHFGQLLIGRSTHSSTDARQSIQAGADYAFIGPIWRTPSHPSTTPLGVNTFADIAGLPVLAIGGIDLARAQTCLEHGAYGVAVISSVWNHPRPASVVNDFLGIINDVQQSPKDGATRKFTDWD